MSQKDNQRITTFNELQKIFYKKGNYGPPPTIDQIEMLEQASFSGLDDVSISTRYDDETKHFIRTSSSLNGTFRIEKEYRDIDNSPYRSSFERKDDAFSNINNLIRRKVFFCVSTKYGPLSFVIEDDRSHKYKCGYKRSVALIKGMDQNKENMIFNWVYNPEYDADEIRLGKEFFAAFSKSPYSWDSVNSSKDCTYYCLNNGIMEGFITCPTRSKRTLQEMNSSWINYSINFIPPRIINEVEKERPIARAYFGHCDGTITIVKNGKGVKVKYWDNDAVQDQEEFFESKESDEFVVEDINRAIEAIKNFPSDDKVKSLVINNLTIFNNIHIGEEQKEVISLNSKPFDTILREIKRRKDNNTLTNFVEELLSRISDIFLVSKDEILGIEPNPVAEKKHVQHSLPNQNKPKSDD